MKKTKIVFIILILIIASLSFSGCKANEITEEQKDMLITYNDFKFFDIGEYNVEGCETYVSKTNFDGSLELEYEFDSEKNEENNSILFINSEVEINTDSDEASKAFRSRISAYKIGAKVAGATLKKVEDFPEYLDDVYVALQEYDGNYIGNAIVVRSDNKIISILISGVYIEDNDIIIEFLDTVINE